MDWGSWLIEWFAGVFQLVLGFLLGTIVTGVFTWKVVLPRVMRNKDVQDLIGAIKEGKELLKEVLENQKELRRK